MAAQQFITRGLCFALPLLAPLVSAVALSNFNPPNTDLTSACDAVYRSDIPGCTNNDFSSQVCSAACANGLGQQQQAIQRACQSDTVVETSLVGLFLLGRGIPILCPNFQVQTVGPANPATSAAAPAPPAATSAVAPAPAPQPAPTSAFTMTSAPPAPPAPTDASAPPPASSSTTAIEIDTNPAPSVPPQTLIPVPSTTSVASKPSQAAQLSNEDSGGGSPFDIQLGGAGATTPFSILTSGTVALAIALAAV